jgi:hypothetical protein
MTFEYNKFADTLLVSLSEPSSLCVYVESQTPGIILRIEESTGIVRSFEVLLWGRRIAPGTIMIPEVDDPEFRTQWLTNLSLIDGKG